MNVCIFFILVVSFTEVLSCALDNGSDDWYAKDENKKFTCSNGKIIRADLQCDGYPDCNIYVGGRWWDRDTSDEESCSDKQIEEEKGEGKVEGDTDGDNDGDNEGDDDEEVDDDKDDSGKDEDENQDKDDETEDDTKEGNTGDTEDNDNDDDTSDDADDGDKDEA